MRKGGTIIIFFDLWKITALKDLLEKYKFKQVRMIEWIKMNPQPLNSKVNYLTNCREIALTAIKDKNQHLIVNMITVYICIHYKVEKIDFILHRRVWNYLKI